MWIENIASISEDVSFSLPASNEDLDAMDALQGGGYLDDLRSLLAECDGVQDDTGVEFVWSAKDVLEKNMFMRSFPDFQELYMPFDGLIFFGEGGGGDRFAFVVRDGRRDVFVWEHESDSRRWVANNLGDFIERYLRANGEDWYLDAPDM